MLPRTSRPGPPTKGISDESLGLGGPGRKGRGPPRAAENLQGGIPPRDVTTRRYPVVGAVEEGTGRLDPPRGKITYFY